jgi:hypothetical protein
MKRDTLVNIEDEVEHASRESEADEVQQLVVER